MGNHEGRLLGTVVAPPSRGGVGAPQISYFTEMLDALCLRPEDVVLFLRAYIDDSGSDHEQRISLLGGILGSRERTEFLDAAWRERLAYWDLSYFKASEANYRKGQFHGWSRKKKDDCMFSFADAILDSKVTGVTVACDREKLAPVFADIGVEYVHEVEYSHLAGNLAAKIAITVGRLEEQNSDRADIAVFFDRQKGRGIARLMLESGPLSKLNITSEAWVDSQKVVLIQAADLLSWSRRRRCCHPDGKPTRVFTALESMHHHEDVDPEGFRGVWSKMLRETARGAIG